MTARISRELDRRLNEAIETSTDADRLRADLDRFWPNAVVSVVKGVETARIRRVGDRFFVEFGRDFLDQQLQAPEDLLFVFLHECFHHVLGHLSGRGRRGPADPLRRMAEDIAADILVNRVVCERFFPAGGVGLLRRLYDERDPIAALLRPPEGSRRHAMRRFRTLLREGGAKWAVVFLASRLYLHGWFEEVPFEALVNGVARLLGRLGMRVRIVFLGDHTAKGRIEGLPWDKGGAGAGYAEEVVETEVPEPVVAVRSPRVAMAVRAALDQDFANPRRVVTPTAATSPLFGPGRQDYPFLAMGLWPTLFHGPRYDVSFEDQRARVYVDVSGSFDDYQARVFGFLVALRDEVGPTVYQFSNTVEGISIEQIARGVKRTTGGTDFDCVIEHALRHRFRRIVVITDGIGQLDSANAQAFQASGASLYLVLTEDAAMGSLGPLPPLARQVWELDG